MIAKLGKSRDAWNPVAMNNEQVVVELKDPEATSDYYQTIFKPKWDKWHGAV